MIKRYLFTVGDAFSQLFNAVFFNSGNANQSFSARCYQQRDHWFFGPMRDFVDILFFPIEEDHCEKSYLKDIQRARHLLDGVLNEVLKEVNEDNE